MGLETDPRYGIQREGSMGTGLLESLAEELSWLGWGGKNSKVWKDGLGGREKRRIRAHPVLKLFETGGSEQGKEVLVQGSDDPNG